MFALHISFLLGMQLMFGHEPPIHWRSTTAVCRPDRARSQASSFPPCPLPSTSASYRSGAAIRSLQPKVVSTVSLLMDVSALRFRRAFRFPLTPSAVCGAGSPFRPRSRQGRTGSIIVDRPRSWTNQRQRHNTCDVEEIAFVSGRSELCASIGDAQQLDRAETIRQMNREDCYCEQDDARNADERDEASDQDGNATQNFSGDRQPGHQLRSRNADGVKDRRERFWSTVPFRKAMCEKSITNNQSKGDRRVGRRLRPHIPPSPYVPNGSRHCVPPCASVDQPRTTTAFPGLTLCVTQHPPTHSCWADSSMAPAAPAMNIDRRWRSNSRPRWARVLAVGTMICRASATSAIDNPSTSCRTITAR